MLYARLSCLRSGQSFTSSARLGGTAFSESSGDCELQNRAEGKPRGSSVHRIVAASWGLCLLACGESHRTSLLCPDAFENRDSHAAIQWNQLARKGQGWLHAAPTQRDAALRRTSLTTTSSPWYAGSADFCLRDWPRVRKHQAGIRQGAPTRRPALTTRRGLLVLGDDTPLALPACRAAWLAAPRRQRRTTDRVFERHGAPGRETPLRHAWAARALPRPD